MNLKYLVLCIAIAFVSCTSSGEGEHDHEKEGHDHNGETANEPAENSSDEIIFSPEKAARFGVKTIKIAPKNFHEVIKVSGIICPAQGDEYVISATSSGIIHLKSNVTEGASIKKGMAVGSISSKEIVGGDANDNARISFLAAKKELDRITPLYKDKIVTEKEYNAAKETYEKARISYQPATVSGSAPYSAISGTITQLLVKDGSYVEVGSPIAVVSQNSKLMLRADLPEKYVSSLNSISTANFRTAYSDNIYELASLNAHKVSGNNISMPSPGYIPIYFEFQNKDRFIPNSYVDIFLISSSKSNSIVVPMQSITEEQGEYFVYVKIDEEGYNKRQVRTGLNDGKEIEIISGLKAGEEVVTDGAILIKLTSNAAAVPGHSHEH